MRATQMGLQNSRFIIVQSSLFILGFQNLFFRPLNFIFQLYNMYKKPFSNNLLRKNDLIRYYSTCAHQPQELSTKLKRNFVPLHKEL